MPSKTYVAKNEKAAAGENVLKDRLKLLTGGNAAGGFKLKPKLVYQSENPRAVKGKPKGISRLIRGSLSRNSSCVYASKYLLQYSAYGSDSHSYLQVVL
jgi:hypothetical protein